MKKSLLKRGFAVAVAICGIMLSSCGESNGVLTKSDVEREAEKKMFVEMDYYTVGSLRLGYYEVNDDNERFMLHELAAAGMITYKAECIVETTRHRWYGKQKHNHVFVEVALTEEGSKYLMTQLDLDEMRNEIQERNIDKDLVCPNEDTVYPEASVPYAENMPIIDDEPKEPEKPQPAKKESVASSSSRRSTTTTTKETPEEPKAPTAYEKALDRVSSDYVTIKLFKVDIYKVRNIVCTPEMLEKGEATAELIMEYVDVTPFGRIMKNIIEGQKMVVELSFFKQVDGWILKEE